jgi:hypothetical protein
MTDLASPEPRSLDERCVIVIATRSPMDCLEAITHALPRSPGWMRGLSLKPVGMQFEVTLRLSGLAEAGAERVASLISAWPNAGSVKVEHQWMRS